MFYHADAGEFANAVGEHAGQDYSSSAGGHGYEDTIGGRAEGRNAVVGC